MLNQSGLETPRPHLPRLAAWSLAASLAVGPASFAQPGLALWLAEGEAVLKARMADGELQVAFAEEAPVRAVAVDDAAGRVWFYAGGFLHAVATDGSPRITITVPTADDPRVAIDLNDSDGTVWLGVGSQLWRYSSSGTELATVALPSSVRALEVDPGRQAVWAATETGLRAFDLVSGSPVDWWFPLPGGGPPTMDVSLSAETGWIYEIGDGKITRLLPDPDFGWTVVSFQVPAPDAQVVVARTDGAYFATPDTLHRISEDGVILWSVTPFGGIVDLEVDPSDGSVWVAGSRQIAQVSDTGNVLRLFAFQSLVQIQDLDLSIDLVFDVTPPQIAPVSPPPGSAVSTASPTIQAIYTDDSSGVDVSTVRLVLDGADRTGDAIVTTDHVDLVPSQALSDGFHSVHLSLSDHSANPAQTAWSFLVDTLPPSILLDEPPAQLITAEPTVKISVVADDAGSGVDGGSLRVVLDGVELTSTCSFTTIRTSCLSPPLEDGQHQIELLAQDRAGNVTTLAHHFELRVDQNPPTVIFAEPADGAHLRTSTIPVTGTVSDDTAITSLRVNGQETSLVDGEFSATVTLVEGANEIFAVATDTVNRQGKVHSIVILDTQMPTLTVDSPRGGQLVNSQTVTVRGVANDDNGVSSVEINGLSASLTEDRFEAEVSIAEGINLLTLRALDAAGNVAEEILEVTGFTLPNVAIHIPADLSFVAATTVDVSGVIEGQISTIVVNGVPAEVSGSSFLATDIPLIEGGNVLTATATDAAGHMNTDSVQVVRDLTPPRLAVEHPLDGALILDDSVTVRGLVNDVVAGTVNASEATVTVNGHPAEVANRSFLAPDVPLVLGENVISVAAVDAGGNEAHASITVRRQHSAAGRIRANSGDRQQGVVGTLLAEPFIVAVVDATGLPAAGKQVIFKLQGSNGSLDGGLRQVAAVTDAEGRAATRFTLGTRAGVGNQVVEALAVGIPGSVSFTVTALPAAPAHLFVDAGAEQVGIVGQALPRPLVAVVTDSGFNRLDGVAVRFSVVKGGGQFEDGSREVVVLSDSDGRAIVPFILGSEPGTANHAVEATIAAVEASPKASFVASARTGGDPTLTSISGVVLDNSNLPIQGVTLRIKEQPTRIAVTDAQGTFLISGAPVGTFHLIADGSTAERPGAWPDLEFVITTIPGQDNTVGMPIYLLPLDLAGGLVVSETSGGTLTLADVPGFALEIVPGSVVFPGGSRSGVVSVTMVHSDKVPMVPNFGQQPRFIVTIQPAGARFDPPARLTLPNLEALEPGEVTELYSFDHDLGHFVSIGPATVSDDGLMIASNSGVGILKAGWHCGGNPATSGTAHDCPTCQRCSGTTCVPNDSELLTQEEGNCRAEVCRDGTPGSESDDSDAPSDLDPHDCLTLECLQGRPQWRSDISEEPEQTEGNCYREKCPAHARELDPSDALPGMACCIQQTLFSENVAPYDLNDQCCAIGKVLPKGAPLTDLDSCPDRVALEGYTAFSNGCSNPVSVPSGDRDNPAGGFDTHFSGVNLANPIERPCDSHDKCWGSCKPAGQSDDGYRQQCDTNFCEGLDAVCANSQDPDKEVIFNCFFWAANYCDGIRFGVGIYVENQKEVCQCCP